MKNKLIIIFILLLTLTLIGCSPDNQNPIYNVTSITIENKEIELAVGSLDAITIYYDGIGDFSDLNISTKDTNLISLEENFITGVAPGIATIEVSAKNDETIKDFVTVYVYVPGYKKSFVRLTGPTNGLKVGGSMELHVDNLKSLNATGNQDFIFTVADPTILKLEGYTVTALKEGSCLVQARQINYPANVGEFMIYIGLQSTNTTNRGEPDNTPLVAYFDDNNYTIDASVDEQVRITGANNYQRYKFTPSDEDILLISDTGLFMGVKEGEVEVTIYSKDSKYKNTFTTLKIKVTGERKRDYLPIVLQTALAEEGYREWTGNNDTKYGEWNNCNYEAWCATFVSWVMNNAGVPKSICIRSIAVRIFEGTYRDRDQFKLKGEYQPQPGDLIIFSSAGAGHIGIVVSSDETTVYTIEGNTSNRVAQRSYPLDHETITGYAVLNYNE